MPPVEVKRITQPRTVGLLYNGDNFIEVVNFYLKGRYASIEYRVNTQAIDLTWVSSEDNDGDGYMFTINVGDWIIQEDKEKFVVKASEFSRKFAQHPPPDHKIVSAATGKEVAWDDVTY